MSDEHSKFPGFKEVGYLDVDAGSIWLGDGCYVLKDKDEQRPKDLGDDWHGICDRFFDRSGYNATQREFQNWHSGSQLPWITSDEYKALEAERPERPQGYEFDHNLRRKPEAELNDYERWFLKSRAAFHAFDEKWKAENPFTPTAVDTGVAQFNHDLGHSGMGMMISTYYGDGSYPVYVEYGEHGRPRRVLIDFDPGADEEEEEFQEAAE